VDLAGGFVINPVIDGFPIPATDAPAMAPGPVVTQYASRTAKTMSPPSTDMKIIASPLAG
jgi:hypothetical protein